jgi:hypothetical protein
MRAGSLQLKASRLWSSLLLSIIFAALALAQASTGGIRGAVTDPAGDVLPKVTVIVKNLDTGIERRMTTNDEGLFNADNLQPGEYEVRIEAQGFQRALQRVTVLTGNTHTADFSLTVGSSSETVVITSEAAQINTTDYKIDGVVTRERIEALPLNGRNFLELAQLEPGVTVTSTSTPGTSINNFTSVSIAGVSGALTRIAVDGATVNDRVTGGSAQNFSQETVQEFQISTFSFDLSTSVTAIGSINIVSRTGTNSLHGSGFFYFRDHNMAAYPNLRRQAANPDPFFARRQSGFSLGGPFKKDKLFWFTNFEYNNQMSVFEVAHTHPAFFPFNHIGQAPLRAKQFNARVDYKVNDQHNAFLRYSQENNNSLQPSGNMESNWIQSQNKAYNGVLGVTSVLTPRVVSDIRFNYNLLAANLASPDSSVCSIPAFCLGLGGPQITVAGTGFVIGNNNNVPQDRANRTYQLTDTISWQKGTHRIRLGGEWEHYVRFGAWDRHNPGQISLFSPETVRVQNPTLFNALPATLRTTTAGAPTLQDILKLPMSTLSIGIGDPSSPAPYNRELARRNDRYRLFFQDAWQVRPRFTFNYGLGWHFEDNIRNYDLPKPEYLRPILGGAQADLSPPPREYKLFAPAIGFAWTLGKQNKTVIRGGSGIYYDSDLGWTRISERRLIGPSGNGRVLIAGSAIPNPLAGQTGQPATLQQLAPGGLSGEQVLNMFAAIRGSETAKLGNGKDLSIRNIEVYKVAAVGGNAVFDHDTRTPYTIQTTAGVQREIARNLVVSADFIMRRGVGFGGPHGIFEVDYNRFNSVQVVSVNPTTGVVTNRRTPIIPECTAAQRNDPRAQCSLGQIAVYQSGSNSRYLGLHVKVDKRFSDRYQFTVSYAFSRYNTWNGIINNNNFQESYGINAGDRPHRLTVSGIWELPEYKGDQRLLRGILNSWQVSTINQFVSTPPLNPFIAVDMDGEGISFFALPGIPWNGFGRGYDADDIRKAVEQYNATFPTPDINATNRKRTPQNQVIPIIKLPDTFSNGDTFITSDLRLTRVIKFGERARLSLIGEAFNLFNIANLGGYSGTLNALVASGTQAATFGQPTTRTNQVFGSGGPRAFQVAARFSF